MTIPEQTLADAKAAAKSLGQDVFLYNGQIRPFLDLLFVEDVHQNKSSNRVTLYLTTTGGDPDAAYKMARYLQETYEHVTVVISGKCKSAGTLIALGAHELVFTPFGELGPLDIQLSKIDKFDQMQSGLAIQDALNTLEQRALGKFFEVSKTWIDANQGQLSFAAATKASCDFVAQLYAPIFARIDPEEVGAKTRSMRIASDYGKRLALKSQNLRSHTLKQLAETYSSHSFVIDQQEAASLFLRVRAATQEEKAVVSALGLLARFESMTPSDHGCYALHEPNAKTAGVQHDQVDGAASPPANGGDSPRANGQAGAVAASD